MGEAVPSEPTALLRRITIPVAAAVAVIVGAAWYATWTSADFLMALVAPSTITSTDLALFFALLLVMMVAMMLPSALPMILAYRGLTRLEAGRIVRPADALGTFAFVGAYFLVWGAFGVAALFALMALGIFGTRIAHPFQSSAGGGIVLSSRTGEKKTQGTASSPPTTAMTSAGYTPMTSPRPPPTRFPMGRVPQTRKRIVALSRP